MTLEEPTYRIREYSREYCTMSNHITEKREWVCVSYNLCITSIFCIFIFFIKTFLKISNFVRMPMRFCSEVLEGCCAAWRCRLIPCFGRGLWKHSSSYRGFLGIHGGAGGRFESMSCLLLMGSGCFKHLMSVLSFHCSTCLDFAWLERCSLFVC